MTAGELAPDWRLCGTCPHLAFEHDGRGACLVPCHCEGWSE